MGAGSSKIDEDVGNLNKNFDDLLSNFNTYKNVETVRTYQPKGDYASKGDLSSYQPKGEYQTKGDYAYRGDLSNYQTKGEYALKGDLSSYQPRGEYQPKGDYQPRGDYQPKGDYQPRGEYALKTDDPKNIDYGKLAGKISAVDEYNRKIAEQIAASPGVLGDSLNEKISSNDAFISKVGKLLEDNNVFTDSVVNILTDANKGFRNRIVGPKGDPGELSGNVSMIKKNLYDKKMTVWCADGDVCNLPVGSKGFVSGEDILLTPKTVVNVAGNANVSGKLDVVGDAKVGTITSSGQIWGAGHVRGDTITAQTKLDVKGPADVTGKLNVVGDANFAGFSATNANVSGNARVSGKLDVNSYIWTGGGVDADSVNARRNVGVGGKLDVGGDANVDGKAKVSGRLDVKGDTQFEGIWANKGLYLGENARVGGKLDVNGADGLNVVGPANFKTVTSSGQIWGAGHVRGDTITAQTRLDVKGPAQFEDMYANKGLSLGGALKIGDWTLQTSADGNLHFLKNNVYKGSLTDTGSWSGKGAYYIN